VVLHLALLDDDDLGARARRRVHARTTRASLAEALSALAAVPLALAGVERLLARLAPPGRVPRPLRRLADALAPIHAANAYGLFASMTTDRPEIVIEGSDDGRAWREYGFRYKPGDPRRPPRLVAPHQPRLDWQLWFAALGARAPWFDVLMVRLLQGEPTVLALLGENPFPGRPPRFARALLYDYRMADPATRRATGAWWLRELRGYYYPPCALPSTLAAEAAERLRPPPPPWSPSSRP
jgi:hypothetical protein